MEPGKRAIVDATLEAAQAQQARLVVKVDIQNAEIYLDDRLIGVSPQIAVDVTPGDHTVLVKPQSQGPGRAPQTKAIRIESGKEMQVSFQYVPTASLDAPSNQPVDKVKGGPDSKDESNTQATGSQEGPRTKETPEPEAKTPETQSDTAPSIESNKASGKPAPNEPEQAATPNPTDSTDTADKALARTMASSAVPLGVSQGALTLQTGYPFFAGLSASVGIADDLQIAFGLRSIAHIINEFEISGKLSLLRQGSFALAAEGGIGFGLGGDERNSFLMTLRGLASLLLGSDASLTAHLGLHFYSDRTGPETEAATKDRTQVLQVLLGLTLELAISKNWNLAMRFEGDPIGGSSCGGAGRCMYTVDFMKDGKMYGGLGFTRTF